MPHHHPRNQRKRKEKKNEKSNQIDKKKNIKIQVYHNTV